MAEQDDAQERTQSATEKRRKEAREKGQVAKSRDLNAAAVTVLCCAVLVWFGDSIAAGLGRMMRDNLQLHFELNMSADRLALQLGHSALLGFIAVLPVMVAGIVGAFLAPLSLSGWNFTMQALVPDFGKLDPVSGLGRVFSANGLIELAKSFVKMLVVGFIAVMVLKNDAARLMDVGNQSLATAIASVAHICSRSLLLMSCGLLLLAAIDVPLQLWQYNKQLRMSHEEIKQEMKESEGSPEVKGKIRRMQQEVARRRMMTEVPSADVVITNPTHFAVALRYDDKKHRAPIVIAKGADEVAARIREIAKEHSIPLFEAPPLARVLYRSVDLNREIPASLYVAVAQVLTYIFQLRAFKKGMAEYPDRPVVEVAE
jgi:flagellar biosynthesis protein FlhB